MRTQVHSGWKRSQQGTESDLSNAYSFTPLEVPELTCHRQHLEKLLLVNLSASILVKRLKAKQDSRASC